LKLLDSAMQKMAAETGSQCGGCGKWLGMTPGYVRALGQQWHPQCFRWGSRLV
jgi:xanthine dehydrogenase iron-sulfur cluster and FAD-binding subunit A